jgi:heat shock protein 90kDa beta
MQSLMKEGAKFGDEDENVTKKLAKAYKSNYSPLTSFMKELLTGKINKVTVSERVDTTPAIVVTAQWGHTANMERIMKAQTMSGKDTIGKT